MSTAKKKTTSQLELLKTKKNITYLSVLNVPLSIDYETHVVFPGLT